ncbi:hypothetical protein AMATHDRAFT_147092 [Amanita thiersii Skay4041]|uniref:Pentacotripeptide-repeat region of PRORP domain-containing protein n=1 Tax=Amanita thiersii Skay4041 TaxID=703135 RepID=A0A2A9NHZ9_9AGAR|nr:hypothetical protein AMATHDRAFT_147092 [Amanita thiersii Skay4041]
MSLSNRLIQFCRVQSYYNRHPCFHSPLWLTRFNGTVAYDTSVFRKIASLTDRLRAPSDPNTIHNLYPALVLELKKKRENFPVPPPLNQSHLLVILEKLGESARPADLQRIEDILQDMPSVFGTEPSLDIHTAILRALREHGNLHTMQRWLQTLPTRPGKFLPNLEQFHLLLEACAEFGSFKQMRNIVLSMRKAGCKPSIDTFKLLIQARWDFASREGRVPHLIVFSTVLEDMKREGLPYDQSVSDLLFIGYTERGMPGYAEEIQTAYCHIFPEALTPEQEQIAAWNTKLSQVAQTRGIEAAITTFQTLQREGCTASPGTVRSILRHSRKVSDILLVEKRLDIKASVDHYSLLISNCVRIGYIDGAFTLYEASKSAGLRPVAPLVAPIITSLCQTNSSTPRSESLDKALRLYDDLAASNPLTGKEIEKTSYDEHSRGPDLNIYQNLLRGIAASAEFEKYYSVSQSLLQDMDVRGIPKTDSITATSIIVLHMRHSQDSSDALTAYETHRGSLDEKGYAIVLNAYSKLTFGRGIHIPSLTGYFAIVRDMRRAGLPLTVEVYTILLRQLANIAAQLRQRERTHDLLTLDAGVSPDAIVWNQLMDTYQRLDCFGDAYRVWELMYLTGRFDHVSVSIILDGCGYAGAWQVASEIRRKLIKDNFTFNQHNWNTWIECLCRLGRLDDAVKVVCLEMGKNGIVSPDVESVRVLHKFSGRFKQRVQVLARLRQWLPDLWMSLPPELQNP